MPVTVQGTQITFNNGTVQTTAFTNPFQLQNQLFTTSGSTTWTAPAGVTRVKATVIGGGGGGAQWAGSRGGGGGFACSWVTVSPGTGYTATVGGGGNTTGNNSPGGSGGTSSFGGFLSATGGGGGSNSGFNVGGNGSGSISSGTAIAVGTVYYGSNPAQITPDVGLMYVMGYPPFIGTCRGGGTGSVAYSGTSTNAAGGESTGGVVYLEWVAP